MATQDPLPERVFVSYSHEGNPHDALVLDLTDRLRQDGIEAMCDQYCPAPSEGWPKWMDKQIESADFVLIICTQTYLQRLDGKAFPAGKGVIWETTLLYQLIYDAVANFRFVPVLLPGATAADIPNPLKPVTRYVLTPPFSFDDPGYVELYRRITKQPSVQVPNLGPRHALPPVKRAIQREKPAAALDVAKPAPTAGDPTPEPQTRPGETKRQTSPVAKEGRKPLSLADISTIIGLVVNFVAIISFVLGNTTASELLALAGVMWVFSLCVAIGWPHHRRVAIAAVCALPLLLGSGFLIRQWWRRCPDDKLCVVFAPFDRDDGATFEQGIKRDLEDLKNYPELKVVASAQKNEDEDQAFADAQRAGATLAFWGDFKTTGPGGAGMLASSYRIFGIGVPQLSEGTLFRNDNIPNENWSKSLTIQSDVQKKAVYLTKVTLGLAAWKRKDFDTAIARLSDALDNPPPPGEDAPSRALVYLYRGRSLAQRRRFADAIKDYQKVLSLDVTQTAALRAEGKAYFAQSLFAEAIRSFTDCIARDQRDALAFDGRGLAYLRRGTAAESQSDASARLRDLAAAKDDIGKAIDLDPRLPVAYNDRGLLNFAQGASESALEDLKSAVEIDPHYVDAFDNLGRVYTSLKRYPDAITAYSEAKKFATPPFDTVAETGRGTAYSANHQYELAIADFTKVLSCRPSKDQVCDSSQVGVFQARADAYDRMGRYDDAIADFAQAMVRETDPLRLAMLRYNAGRIFNEKGDSQLAFGNLSQALLLDKGFAIAFYERADVQQKLGHIRNAMADLQECLRLTTDDNMRNAANYRLNELKQLTQDGK